MEIKTLRGIKDILPVEIKKWQYVELNCRKILENFNFSEIRTPIFEKTELFIRSVGKSSDIVNKEMYTFIDKGGESITLKPEGTASVIRAYLEHKMYAQEQITKLYYFSPMFRYERPQSGRYRQHYQLGVEVIGTKNFIIDLEIFILITTILETLGMKNFEIKINSVGCNICRNKYIEVLKESIFSNISSFCEDCQNRFKINPLRILDCKKDNCRALLQKGPFIKDFLCSECKDHHLKLIKYLDFFKVKYVLDSFLVRGLDYYTKTVFEITSPFLGAQNSFGGGGRYDKLVQELGGNDISCIGFSFGLERLIQAMEKSNVNFPEKKEIEFYFVYLGEKALEKIIELVFLFRTKNYYVHFSYENVSFKNQLKQANKLGVKYCLILGENELQKELILLKDMEQGIQEEVSLQNLVKKLEELVK
ncbi:MAG: histidine--tRNA ligase [bacterium]